ncbi:MAG: polynucleotide adenylyltransferase PcnB [Chromatiales bacterium]|nr:polynucleotide adenylyltransferase PcnB [Chromatiales bacterium]
MKNKFTLAKPEKGKNFGLSRNCISKEALAVIKVLQRAGYRSYIVGGGVRDLLLNKQPKDFDIATAAHPAKIRNLFKRCRLIGKRFRLAHVFYNGDLLEVATFRTGPSNKTHENLSIKNWCVVSDNRYGTLEEDLMRRDFTVNAMYYDPFNDDLICHPNALSDIEDRCLRVIGNPLQRYREDPVRMLRGLRLATKLGLNLEQEAKRQIIPNRSLLLNIPPARLFEECKKLFLCGALQQIFEKLRKFQLLELLFPQTEDVLRTHPKAEAFEHFLNLLFSETDRRIASAKSVNPAFTIAGLWWLSIDDRVRKQSNKRLSHTGLWQRKTDEIAAIQHSRVAIPKYILHLIYEIYRLQPYFTSHNKSNIYSLIRSRRFRAAYDFFHLLAKAELADMDTCQWWKTFQQVDQQQRGSMIADRIKGYSEHHLYHPVKVEARC